MGGLLALPLIQVSGLAFPVPEWTGPSWPALSTSRGTDVAPGSIRPALGSPPSPEILAPHEGFVDSDAPKSRERSSRVGYLVLLTGWMFGLAMILGRLLNEGFRIRNVIDRSQFVNVAQWQRELDDCANRLGVFPSPRFLLSREIPLPIAWGDRPGTVVLPMAARGWSESRRRAVLLHELAHLRRRDWLTGWMAEMARALYWPHPLAWWGLARLRAEAERACDDLVLAGGVEKSGYARDLLDLAVEVRPLLGIAGGLKLACRRGIGSRISAILDRPGSRRDRRCSGCRAPGTPGHE